MSVQVGMNLSGNYAPQTSTATPGGDDGKTFGLLDINTDNNGWRYLFVSASGATISQYQVVGIGSTGNAQALTSALAQAGNRIGVAPYQISSGSYGWVQLTGVVTISVLSTCSSNTVLYTSATAGSLDDTSTSQVKIANIQTLANITAVGNTAAYIPAEPFAQF